MINLKKQSGLPIEVDEKTFRLKFGEGMADVTPSIRKFEEMKQVLMDPDVEPAWEDLYFIYRDVHMSKDEKLIRDNQVRYDITVIPPSMLGQEFVKTAGHYHSKVPGEEYGYPELYEVLHGQALFLIEKMGSDPDSVRTIMAIRAEVGDKVVYPPNYGHIIINPGKEVLITANWVSSEYTADYKSIADKHGMAYYILKGTDKQFEVVQNKHYASVPEIKFAKGHMNTSLGFMVDEPMYETGIRHPGRLEFLNKPHKYAVELSSITS